MTIAAHSCLQGPLLMILSFLEYSKVPNGVYSVSYLWLLSFSINLVFQEEVELIGIANATYMDLDWIVWTWFRSSFEGLVSFTLLLGIWFLTYHWVAILATFTVQAVLSSNIISWLHKPYLICNLTSDPVSHMKTRVFRFNLRKEIKR